MTGRSDLRAASLSWSRISPSENMNFLFGDAIDRNSGCPLHILGESSELQIAAIKSALLTSSVLFDNSKSKANNIPTKKPRSCPNLRSSSADLNYPSFSVVFKPHNLIHITRRTVTNVGAAPRVCEMAVNSSGHSP